MFYIFTLKLVKNMFNSNFKLFVCKYIFILFVCCSYVFIFVDKLSPAGRGVRFDPDCVVLAAGESSERVTSILIVKSWGVFTCELHRIRVLTRWRSLQSSVKAETALGVFIEKRCVVLGILLERDVLYYGPKHFVCFWQSVLSFPCWIITKITSGFIFNYRWPILFVDLSSSIYSLLWLCFWYHWREYVLRAVITLDLVLVVSSNRSIFCWWSENRKK